MTAKFTRVVLPMSKVKASAAGNGAVPEREFLKPIPWTNRPPGDIVDDYPGVDKWTWRQFAWEFLRRNSEFQLASDGGGVVGDFDEPPEVVEWLCRQDLGEDTADFVAEYFGLLRFKHFSEDYGQGARPQFAARQMRVYSWLADQEQVAGGKRRRLPPPLRHGQVMLKFSLLPVVHSPAALDTMFRLARRKLEKLVERQRIALETPGSKAKQFAKQELITALRLLDLKASGATPEDTFAMMGIDVPDGSTPKDALKSRMRFADEMVNDRYRFLATR